ncbi:hypothetical protein LTR82_017652 [Friedmanniomyces endolithicus]|uniref:Carrier domain-containing protein n=1 Tax=Friedmanniomyces endolithicus TaxID=329885 RepID=A0AAN6F655_9PEZI|nr:hypothetical protein LTR82_017652 [Friedmanniomyces endolithicus]
MLVCRIRFDNEATVSQMLRDVKKHYLASLSYRSCPLVEILRTLQSAEDGLFNSALSVQSHRRKAPLDPKQSNYRLVGGHDPSEYKIIVQIADLDDRVEIGLRYHEAHLSHAYADAVVRTLDRALRSLITLPESLGSRICTVHEQDQASLTAWQGSLPAAAETHVQTMIEKQVALGPDEEAICCDNRSMTYEELNGLANGVANRLAEHGVGPGAIVPILFEKSIYAIVSMFGILKAGAASVPLDPAGPESRWRYILSQTGSSVALVSQQHRTTLQGLVRTLIVVDPQMKTEGRNRRLRIAPGPTDPAHLIFSSGSTGRPKAVVWSQSSFASSIQHQLSRMDITASSRVYQFSATVEIMTALCVGACVCIPTEQQRLNDSAAAMRRMAVTWAFFTPSSLRTLDPLSVPRLQTLVVGGEHLDSHLLSRWQPFVENLILGYGPCECGPYTSAGPYAFEASKPSVGRPLGCRVWLVHPTNVDALVPHGAIGEIIVEGPIVGSYLQDPTLTSSSFFTSPAWCSEEAVGDQTRKFFKTGDLGRLSIDGTLTVIARKDHQVKVRGQRLELAEVETSLMKSSIVEHAVVLYPQSGLLSQRLVAVLGLSGMASKQPADSAINLIDKAIRSTIATDISVLRKHARDTLPAHGIPALFIPLTHLPSTASRKIDRQSVSQWVLVIQAEVLGQIAELQSTGATEAPHTAVERAIQQTWADVLGIPSARIGRDSSFLIAGGDSISAVKAVSSLRRQGLHVVLQDMLRSKSLSSFPQNVHRLPSPGATVPDIADRPFALSPIQTLRAQLDPTWTARFNQSSLVKLKQAVSNERLERSLALLVEHHSMLRARLVRGADGSWAQEIRPDVERSICTGEQSFKTLSDAQPLIDRLQDEINPQTGPILAAYLFNTTEGSQYLFMAAHHLVVDLVSWNIILEDLEQLLSVRQRSLVKTMPFSAWCRLQESFAADYAKSRRFLPERLPTIDLSYWGMEGRRNSTADDAYMRFKLTNTQTAAIMGPANAAYATETLDLLIVSILASFSQTFDDRSPPTIFSEGHGREAWDSAIDVARTVGWFTTLTPIRTGSGRITTAHAVTDVKDARRRIAFGGLPYFVAAHTESSFLMPLELIFNFAGSTTQPSRSSLFAPPGDHDLALVDTGVNTARFALVNISARVWDGELVVQMTYNEHMKRKGQIEVWMQAFRSMLAEIAHEFPKRSPEPTLGDYTLVHEDPRNVRAVLDAAQSQAGLMAEAIQDIIMPTAFQIACLQESLAETRGMFNHHILGQTGPVDVASVDSALKQLVERHPILRSVFVRCMGEIFQVVQCRIAVPFDLLQAHNKPSTLATWVADDIALPFVFGSQLFRASLIQHSNDRYSLVLRLPHAAYDAASLALLLDDFRQLYHHAQPEAVGDPAAFARFLAESRTLAVTHWRRELLGAAPTVLYECRELEDRATNNCTMRKTITAPNFEGVTAADLAKAAWAMVLAVHTGRTDIVLGQVTQGRNCPVPTIERSSAVCANVIPVRVKFSADTTGWDLLRALHDTHLRNMPFENLDTAQIVNDCTDWPKGSAFGLTLNHVRPLSRNKLGHNAESENDGDWTLQEIRALPTAARGLDVTCFVMDGSFTFEAHFCDRLLSRKKMMELLDDLERMLRFLSSHPTSCISLQTVARENEDQTA